MPKSTIPDCATYIVLDIPDPMAGRIRLIRAKFDPDRSSLPAEITVTGSSGTGQLVPGQSLEQVAAEIDRIAGLFPPFLAEFGKVERFPDTDIYFLELLDPRPFEAIQKALAESSIRFLPNPYPFQPHCTLKLRSAPSDPELLELLFLDAPKEPFRLSKLSLYALPDPRSCERLCTARLRGACGT